MVGKRMACQDGSLMANLWGHVPLREEPLAHVWAELTRTVHRGEYSLAHHERGVELIQCALGDGPEVASDNLACLPFLYHVVAVVVAVFGPVAFALAFGTEAPQVLGHNHNHMDNKMAQFCSPVALAEHAEIVVEPAVGTLTELGVEAEIVEAPAKGIVVEMEPRAARGIVGALTKHVHLEQW